MMYTATMPPAIERIARKYLRRPAIVTIGTAGEAVDTVEQRVEFLTGEDRRKKRLLELLASRAFAPPIIVFVNIKRNCDAVARELKSAGWHAVTLHGSKSQDAREQALQQLRSGTAEVLVATDLAGRGIDVPDVSLVINFNMATSIEQYTHRIGRTGRAGKSGVAVTFLGNEDADVMYDLRQMLTKSAISRVPDELRSVLRPRPPVPVVLLTVRLLGSTKRRSPSRRGPGAKAAARARRPAAWAVAAAAMTASCRATALVGAAGRDSVAGWSGWNGGMGGMGGMGGVGNKWCRPRCRAGISMHRQSTTSYL